MTYFLPFKSLLSIEQLSQSDALALLAYANQLAEDRRQGNKLEKRLNGKIIINLFFENSTRTRMSFELAAKLQGAEVINMAIDQSSLKKGETLLDTALTLNAMKPDVIVIRHQESGAVALLAQKIDCSVVNAGDGSHQHPTQALLDALTILRKKGKIEGLTIAICGDILHSRVARSNMQLLTTLGAKVNLIAPPTLLPSIAPNPSINLYSDMKQGLRNCDIVMMLRIQQERMRHHYIPSLSEFFAHYGLTRHTLSYAKEDALVMHPGPINRGVEIDSDIADDIHRSMILEQVEMGVAIRQAILTMLPYRQSNYTGSISSV
jgi:aspartate carbamoyltransferase catalytic subunit